MTSSQSTQFKSSFRRRRYRRRGTALRTVHHRIGTNHSFELNGYGYPYEMALRITARFAAKGAVIRTALALEAHGRARRSIFRQRTAACDSHFIGKRARNKTKQQRRVRLALRATERKEE